VFVEVFLSLSLCCEVIVSSFGVLGVEGFL